MAEVIVIGAGPAGLVAALEAARAGHRCVVVEAGPRPGGMAAGIEVGGLRVDLGSHRLHPAMPPRTLALVGGLLGDDLQVRPRNGRIRLAGRWIGFPLRAVGLARGLPPGLAARLALDTVTGPTRQGDASSFDAVVRHRFGPTIADTFYRPYAHKLYGLPAERLDPELARRRISASSAGAILTRVARATRPSGRTFLYPRLGFGQLVDRLVDAATEAGVEITTGAPVDAVTLPPGATGPVVVRAGERTWEAAVVLSSMPLGPLVRVVQPAPEAEVTAAAGRLATRAMALVYLALDRSPYTPFDAHYLPGADTVTARLSEPRNYRDGPDPDGRTVLCAELPCQVGDGIWSAGDAELGALVATELTSLGLPPADPVEVVVHRLPSVYPVYDLATAADRELVGRWAAGLERILVFGRQGLAVPDNVHHVLDMGLAAARCVDAGGGLDRARWQAELDRFASNVVED